MMILRLFFDNVFFWGIAMLHFYVILYCRYSVKSGGVSISGRGNSGAGSGCPFMMAGTFFAKNTPLFSHSLLMGKPLNMGKFSVLKSDFSIFSTAKEVTAKGSSPKYFPNYNDQPSHILFAQADSIVSTAPTMRTPPKIDISSIMNPADDLGQEQHIDRGDDRKMPTDDALEVVVLGLSHHNAKVEVREVLAIPEDKWNEVSAGLCAYESISEACVISTCNRFEIYLAGKNTYRCVHDAMEFLYNRAESVCHKCLDLATLRKNLFVLNGEEAIWHLMRVSAGLDSLVVGEGQILSQVKRAYEHGIEADGSSGKVIARLMNTAVTAGKRVRAETGIAKGAVSISHAATEFTASKIAADCGIDKMEDARITIIGAGKMARLLLIHLQKRGVKSVTIVNRSEGKVKELQNEFPDLIIEMRLMDDMWEVIKQSDVVYPSTGSSTTIIDPKPLANALEGRDRPGAIQFVDISVPRNVHADCEDVPNAVCYNVDDLKAVVARNTAKRRREVLEAELILVAEQDKFRQWQQSLGVVPTIAKLKAKAESLRVEELSKSAKRLSAFSDKDRDTVDRVTRGVVAKLLHGFMTHMRQQKGSSETRAAIRHVEQAFQLGS